MSLGEQKGRPLTYPDAGLPCTHHPRLTCQHCRPYRVAFQTGAGIEVRLMRPVRNEMGHLERWAPLDQGGAR